MPSLDQELAARLAHLRAQGLHRQLRRVDAPQSPTISIQGKTLLNFSSNDYLGLANEPAVKAAAAEAAARYGAGSGASRLVCGSLAVHHELEEAIAAFKGVPAALSFSSGYAAALGTICSLVGKEDVIVTDKLTHACLIDAARLCGAELRVFTHQDLADLESILAWADRQVHSGASQGRVLIVTESVFSMDGDLAPLRELVTLKDKYGAWLMVDEAHATGLFGENRHGLAEELGVSGQIEVQLGTLGKALGAAGGYICGSRILIEYLVNRARTFIFSTAPVPAAAAAAIAAIRFVQSAEGARRCRQLWDRVSELHAGQPAQRSAILPVILGAEDAAVSTAAALRERGIFIPAIRYPTVPRGTARLRVTLTATHTPAQIEQLLTAFGQLGIARPGANSFSPAHASAG
jgi:8-amino-7-oxononanoate synthase